MQTLACRSPIDLVQSSLTNSLLMNPLHNRALVRFFAVLAVFVFVGDLVVDAAADLRGDHCASSMSDSSPAHEKAPCSHCSCATHTGAVVVTDGRMQIAKEMQPTALLAFENGMKAVRRAASIDHPPQLA